jgi:hypothetical protein
MRANHFLATTRPGKEVRFESDVEHGAFRLELANPRVVATGTCSCTTIEFCAGSAPHLASRFQSSRLLLRVHYLLIPACKPCKILRADIPDNNRHCYLNFCLPLDVIMATCLDAFVSFSCV